MGLFSFGRKTDTPRRRYTSNARAAPRRESRADSQARIDPLLPEKQRARYRLVGAILLVLFAVLMLPKLLNSPSHPDMGDIEVWVAAQTAVSNAASNPGPAASSIPLPEHPSNTDAAAQIHTPADASSMPMQPSPPVKPESASDPASEPLTASASTQQSARVKNTADRSHFAVQAGVYTRERDARAQLARLKKAKLPAYLEREKQGGRRVRFSVRVGPFSDRKQAQSALKQLRTAGLATGPVERSEND